MSELANLQKYVDAYFNPDIRDGMRAQLRTDIEVRLLISNHTAMLLHDGGALIDYIERQNQIRVGYQRLFVPVYRPMLNQQAVKDCIKKSGLLKYWQNNEFPDFCHPVGEDDFECEGLVSE